MRVLFDHQIFCSQKYGGISTYFYEILMHLPPSINPLLCLVEATNVYAQALGYPKDREGYKRTYFPTSFLFRTYYKLTYRHQLFFRKRFRLNEEYAKRIIKKGEYDIFHPTYFENYYLNILPADKPMVLTVHDLTPEIYPHLFPHDIQAKNRLSLLQRANHIIAVSNNTKQDIIRFYNIPEDKISVIYHGFSPTPHQHSSIVNISSPYMLYVGGRCHYKNFDKFCNALFPVLQKYPHIKVLCTGDSFSQDEIEMLQTRGIQNNFIHYFCKNNQELYYLYHNAICFVYPSAYEGFGLPILEAYHAQCPVMLNYSSCFPEIANDAAIFFEFHEDGSSNFSEKFDLLYCNADFRKDLISRQNQRLQNFSWTKSAQQLCEIYHKVVLNS